MFRFVAFFALFTVAFGGIQQSRFNGRIVNGTDTTISAHPYQVSLQTVDDEHFCGGSIINKNTILTAAHCLEAYDLEDTRIRLGSTDYSSGGVLVKAKSSLRHPKYNSNTHAYDVGLLKLAENVAESVNVRYIQLAKVAPPTGTPAVITGWGTLCSFVCNVSPFNLQMVEVKIVSKTDCASKKYKYGSKIKDSMICAYELYKDSCQGDSGGPLVANSVQVGVVSFGDGCAKPGYPGVYADVAALRSWIIQNSV